MTRIIRSVFGVLCLVLVAGVLADFPFGASDPVYGLRSRRVEDPSFQYTPSPEDWRDVNMYQIFTDRFASSGETLGPIQERGWYVGNRGYPDNRNFHHGGDWKGLLDNLDYLEGMGVTAVWMSGVQMNWQGLDTRFTPYHMYHPTDFFRVDPTLGTFEDLKNVIDAMHARGMYVILDVVINHTADLSGLWGNNREDNRWYWPNGNGTHGWWDTNRRHAPPFDDLQYFHNHGRIRNWDSYPEYLLGAFPGTDDLRTSRQDVRDWLDLAFKNLIEATDCDGFRVDAIKHVEEDWIMQWADSMRQHAASLGKNDFILFGEYFTYDNETLARYARQAGYSFNSALFFPMSQTFMSVFVHGERTSRLTETLNLRHAYGEGTDRLVTFIDNHDVNRIGLEAGSNVGHIEYIMPPALTFLYTATPVPCLFYGTEHAFQQGGHRNGQEAAANYDDHDWQRETMFDKGFQPGPAQGNKLAHTNAPLYQHIARLNRARADHVSLRRGAFAERWSSQNGRGPYAFVRTYGEEQALVSFNTADHTETINPEVDKDDGTSFFNTLNPSETVTVSGGRVSFAVGPKETKIFVAGTAGPQLWIRNVNNWPRDGDAASDTELYVDVEAGPASSVTQVMVYHTTDEVIWTAVPMALNPGWGSDGGHWYNVNLGRFAAGATVRYYVEASDGENTVARNNSGNFFRVTIREGATSDSNGDGVPDQWYLEHGLDPEIPELAHMVGDNGYTYLDAFRLNLDPNDASTTAFRMHMNGSGRPSFSAPDNGRRYILQHTSSLLDPFVDIGEALPIGAEIELEEDAIGFYRIRFVDFGDNNGTEPGPPLTHVGGTHHWVSPDNQVFINSAGYPEGASTAAYIIYCVNPPCDGDWPLTEMTRNADWENGDWWNRDLGILNEGDVVRFAIMMTDGHGNEVWDNNDGQDYTVVIGGGVEPGGNQPYSTNPTFGRRDTMIINGNPAGWTDDHLIALDMANDDPRSLGGNWTMHEAPIDLTHLWAAWDDDFLYVAWQYVDVTDVLDPANAGGAGSGKISNNDGILQWIVIDTLPGEGATEDVWGKKNSWTGPNQPNYQIYLAGSLWQGYISRAVDGVFALDDGGVDYNAIAAAGIQVAKGDTFGGTSLWGVWDADDRHNPDAPTVDFLAHGHNTSRDSFYEMRIPLSYLGITAAHIETQGIGLMVGAGSESSMDSIPHDETTLASEGVTDWNSSLEWTDEDVFTVPFARVGR